MYKHISTSSHGCHLIYAPPNVQYKKGFIATAVSLPPPPTSPDGHARGDSGSSLTASLSGMRRDSSKLLNFPPNLSDIEAAVHDDEVGARHQSCRRKSNCVAHRERGAPMYTYA